MIIRKISIEKYGMYRNFIVDEFTSGFNLIFGLNETGKSTILSFIRACLFDTKKNNYPDNEDIEGIGIIEIEEDFNKYVIERKFGKKSKATILEITGHQQDKKLEELLLNPGCKMFFENIFAFGLDELRSLETLDNEEVRNKIYLSSLGIDYNLISKVEKELKDKLEEIYTTSRAKRKISAIVEELHRIDKYIQARQKTLDEYKSEYSQKLELDAQLNNLTDELSKINKEINKNKIYKDIHSSIIKFDLKQKELESYPDMPVIHHNF